MSTIKIYGFTNPANYVFDPNKIEVDAGCREVFEDNPGQVFTQDFSSSAGFTYDNTLAVFQSGFVRQIYKVPLDATFYVPYTTDINGSWGDGVLTGAAVGGAAVSGGALDLNYGDVRYVDYSAVLNGNSGNTGCIRLKYTPNYSGAPGVNTGIISESNSGTIPDSLFLYQTITGQLWAQLYCGAVLTVSISAPWTPTLGTKYDIEFNWDVITGESRLFINGTQFSTTDNNTGNRATNMTSLKIGSSPDGSIISNSSIEDVLVFSTVQHTANYTPDWSDIYETVYVESKIELPQFVYPGVGAIQEYTNLVTVETNDPRQVWNDLYWNGSAWVTSNGTFMQSSTVADIVANIASFPASDTLDIDIIFSSNNTTQMRIDNLIATYTCQCYPTDDPLLTIVEKTGMEALEGFVETSTKTGSDEIKYALSKNGTDYWHDSIDWEVSDATYAQMNTAAGIHANRATFTTERIEMGIKMRLHSGDGSTTPETTQLTITYDFGGFEDEIHKTIVYGFQLDVDGTPNTTDIIIWLNQTSEYKEATQATSDSITVTPDAEGYWEVELIETTNMEPVSFYFFRIKNRLFKKEVPIVDFIKFNDLDDV